MANSILKQNEIKRGVQAFYQARSLNDKEKTKILQSLPMSQTNKNNSADLFYKLGIGLMGVAVFVAGFLLAMPSKVVKYTPKPVLQYVPAKTQVAYVNEQVDDLDQVDEVVNELDQLQKELNTIDAELAALED